MTNKINGIDVSECVFFREKYTRIGDDIDNDISFENHCMLSECTFNIENCEKINCHFKQLKRLQKENEELKEELNQAVNEFNALMTDIMIDIPFAGIKNTDISIKSHLHKMQKALKALVEIREIVSGNYEMLDPQAKQDIKKLIDEVLK